MEGVYSMKRALRKIASIGLNIFFVVVILADMPWWG